MILLKLAVSYLRQAKARIDDAKDASKAENFPYAVRLSQECVELSIKAALRAVGIEYPKQHEVSDLLEETKKRYPPWFAQEIPFIQETSKSLFRKRELAFYGGEESMLSPEDVINKEDSRKAVSSAERVYVLCNKLISELTPSGRRTSRPVGSASEEPAPNRLRWGRARTD